MNLHLDILLSNLFFFFFFFFFFFEKDFYDGNSLRPIGILTGSPSDKFGTVKLSSGVALTSSGQINY